MSIAIISILLQMSYILFCNTAYFLTPWSTVLLEKLTGFQLVKKVPAFYGTRRFITAFTSAHHLSLPWASLIQPIPPHPTSWGPIWILSSHLLLGLPSGVKRYVLEIGSASFFGRRVRTAMSILLWPLLQIVPCYETRGIWDFSEVKFLLPW